VMGVALLQDGDTALMLAAHGGYTDIVQMLIDAGADPNTEASYNPRVWVCCKSCIIAFC
jgi:ankyrin repeat protein